MAVKNAMYLFEVVVESVKSLVQSRLLVIKSDFADIFSLELIDPKQMHIVIPEPPPLPPPPPGKKGKKAKPKPKKKGKKGKQVEPPPPPEPAIQSGQSVLFTSSAEVLIQNMKKFPLELSLWSKEDNLVYIGAACIPWDPIFLLYLDKISNCQEPPPVTLKEEYNIFEEGTAKMMAKLCIQVKLTYLTEQVTTSFRTLSEDPTVKKFLYTGMNSKTTSYMCTMKTTDEVFEENCNKIANNYVKEKSKLTSKPMVYANYKNAPAANLTSFKDDEFCCQGFADKAPESKYKAPETCPDIDFICDYVKKIITSCNDNMRMLTPRPTIRPLVRATDIDRLCYCRETKWPTGALSQRFEAAAKSDPCPICIDAGKGKEDSKVTTLDVANIRGPCGKPDCKVARTLRAYIQNLVDEDKTEVQINDIIGPCGQNTCTVAEKIQEFLRHQGVFSHGNTLEALSTQCGCIEKMQDALLKREECDSECSKDCEDSEEEQCDGAGCPYGTLMEQKQVYNVYYFTVEYDFDKDSVKSESPQSSKTSRSSLSKTVTKSIDSKTSKTTDSFKFCSTECPTMKDSEELTCSKPICGPLGIKTGSEGTSCPDPTCPSRTQFPPSPADSNVIIGLEKIHNPCCVKSCDVADRVKEFVSDGVMKKKQIDARNICMDDENPPCYCDCVCDFKLSRKTTYCAVCGGYEFLGDDMKDEPEFAKPHPCPIYHKLYDKQYIQVKSPWEEEDAEKQKHQQADAQSNKSGKTIASKALPSVTRSMKSLVDKKSEKAGGGSDELVKKSKRTKKIGKFTANAKENGATPQAAEKKAEPKPKSKPYGYTPVPRYMGWLWTAESVPGMKVRPKWKPGAANKILVRRYRTIREGVDNIAKKKRAMMQRKKKIEMKPTLVIKKTDGEYTVQMEVFKKYSKERLRFQYPYDEKPPLTYIIGKTEEEKQKIQKQRERRERRETRRKSRLLQSTFRDKCQEICVKAYNQAIGILPLPNPNDPSCPCHTDAIKPITPPIDSCSCSDGDTISSSDTDGDDWIIEFTPPTARWDPKAKHPPVLTENECQYNYLDYKVKVLDKQGNQVPRFFKGPDGKQVCSDLGGFWGPGHVWLEINKDGYIGPDNRWVPLNFTGPDGLNYLSEEGVFTDNTGKTWRIGIDGYVDSNGLWAAYPKKHTKDVKSATTTNTTVDTRKTQKAAAAMKTNSPVKSQSTKFGKQEVKLKIDTKAKSGDKKAGSVPDKGKKVPEGKGKNPIVMNFSVNYDKPVQRAALNDVSPCSFEMNRMLKYRDIMQQLKVCEDIYAMKPNKTNRASNTPRKQISPFTMDYCRNKSPIPTCPSSENRTFSSLRSCNPRI